MALCAPLGAAQCWLQIWLVGNRIWLVTTGTHLMVAAQLELARCQPEGLNMQKHLLIAWQPVPELLCCLLHRLVR